MARLSIRVNPQELRALNRAFDRMEGVEEKMLDMTQEYAMRIAQEAQQRSFAVSSRISSSFVLEMKESGGFTSVMVASEFVGYPSNVNDRFGDAGLAGQRGWATFTHRYDLGYDGSNPAAGYTPAHGFLTRPFQRLSEQWADRVMNLAIRAWTGRRG